MSYLGVGFARRHRDNFTRSCCPYHDPTRVGVTSLSSRGHTPLITVYPTCAGSGPIHRRHLDTSACMILVQSLRVLAPGDVDLESNSTSTSARPQALCWRNIVGFGVSSALCPALGVAPVLLESRYISGRSARVISATSATLQRPL